MNVPSKYHLLRVIALVLKGLAWVVLAAGIIGAVVLLLVGASLARGSQDIVRTLTTAGGLTLPLIAIVWFVQLFAFGSILSLLIDIEENTRGIAARPPE